MCPVGAGIWQGMHVHHYDYGLHTRSPCHVGSKHLPNGIVSVSALTKCVATQLLESALTIFTKLHLLLFYKECAHFQ